MSNLSKFTRDLYGAKGYICKTVEWYDARTHRTHDFLGIFDELAIGFGCEIIGIQTTSFYNVPARVKKILASPNYERWLERGGKVHVVGWKTSGEREMRLVEMTRESHPPRADTLNRLLDPEEL